MKWFLDLSTRAKLLIGFGLMILCLTVAMATAYVSIVAIQKSQQDLYQRDFANATDLLLIRSHQNGVRAAGLTMMATTNRLEQEKWHDDIKERGVAVEEIAQKLLDRNRDDPQFLRKLEQLVEVRNAFKNVRDTQIIPLIYAGQTEKAKALSLGVQNTRYETMVNLAEELGTESGEKARAAVEESGRRSNQALRLLSLISIIALLLGVAMTLFLNNIVANPLREISKVAARIADGDLTVQVADGYRRDEVGTLTKTFRRMAENLQETNRELTEGINVLSSSAGEISVSTSQLAANATETATAVTETTTTVEEIRQTSQVANEKARHVAESAQRVMTISQTGQSASSETAAGMERIREQMDSIAESMVRLSEQSQAIGEIIATVDDLSRQSNLLAVNAAIEAAKAGEQGKGFSVVAQEVKSLADQSKQATMQVRTILSDIQKATGAAVMATEQGSKAVEAGVLQSAQAGESIVSLAESITDAAQAATQIAASSQQQLVGMDQVVQAMESIKQASAQNVDGAKQLETAAHGLTELGHRLKQQVERYKV